MRTTRPHANSPFLSKLPALLAALPLLMLAACGGGEVFLQDGVNPGAGISNCVGANCPDTFNDHQCSGPNCININGPNNKKTGGTDDRKDEVYTHCKRGYIGLNCEIKRKDSDYVNNDPNGKLRDACIPKERNKSKNKGRLWENATYAEEDVKTPYSEDVKKANVASVASTRVPGEGGVTVKLHLKSGKTIETTTCTDGWYAFTEQEYPTDMKTAHQGLVELPQTNCATNNCPTTWVTNLDNSKPVNLLVFGGTISTTPNDLKDADKLYPNKLREHMLGMVYDVNITNIAKEKSKTANWAPHPDDPAKSHKLHKDLIDKVGDADIIVFTIGIDDYYDNYLFGLTKAWIIHDMPKKGDEAVENIKRMIDSLQGKTKQHTPIIMLNYIDYAAFSTKFNPVLMPWSKADIKESFHKTFSAVTEKLAGYKGLQIVDIYGKTRYDQETIDKLNAKKFVKHERWVPLSEEGHQLYADELFKVLGGWKGDLGGTRYVGYNPNKKK